MRPIVKPPRFRATWMPIQDVRLLDDWGRHLRRMFHGDVPYLVGSALQRADCRDVDVRIILGDRKHAELAALVSIPRLNVMLSLWGRQVTGLPIDCQVQQMTAANTQHPGAGRRHPLGLGGWDTDPDLVTG